MDTKSDMNKIDLGYELKFSFAEVFGESWLKPLSSLFQSNYMYNLLGFVQELYTKKEEYPRPRKNEIFQAFREVPFENLRVVVLVGGAPFSNLKGNGIALATRDEEYMRPALITQEVEACIERTVYKGCKINFDLTLQHWLNQGVLPINTSLTTMYRDVGNPHEKLWKHFIREVIKGISSEKKDIVFILLGRNARQYKPLINSFNHHVLEYFHPKYAFSRNVQWNCPCFLRANQILASLGGKENTIEW